MCWQYNIKAIRQVHVAGDLVVMMSDIYVAKLVGFGRNSTCSIVKGVSK